MPRKSLKFPRHSIALCFYILAVIICTYPMILHMDESVCSYPVYLTYQEFQGPEMPPAYLNWDMDIAIAVWVYSWNLHQLFRDPAHLFDANIYHPYPHSLAMIDNYLGLALLGLPTHVFFHNPALTYNCILILAIVLTAWSVYGYLLHKTNHYPSALFAGLLIAFLPYHYKHASTIHKSMFLSYPLGMWMIERYFDTQKWRYVILFSGIVIFQSLCTWYLTLGLLLLISCFLVYLSFVKPRRLFRKRHFLAAALSLLLILPVTGFMAKPYFELNRDIPSFERSIEHQHSRNPLIYFTTTPDNLLYGNLLKGIIPVSRFFVAYFPGFLMYILGFAGIVVYLRNRKTRLMDNMRSGEFLLAYGVLSMLLSLGPFLNICGKEIPMPFYVLFSSVPIMKALRGPRDFALVVYFMLAFFSAFACRALFRNRKPFMRFAIFLFLATFLFLESLRLPCPLFTLPYRDQVPGCYQWVGNQSDKPVVAIFFPSWENEDLHFHVLSHYSMYYSIFHFCPILEGHSAFKPPFSQTYFRKATDFPEKDVLDLLQALKVDYVLIDLQHIDKSFLNKVLTRLDRIDALRLTERFEDSLVYRLVLPEHPVQPLIGGIYLHEGISRKELYIYNHGSPRILLYPKDTVVTISIRRLQENSFPPGEYRYSINLPYYMPAEYLIHEILPDAFPDLPEGKPSKSLTVSSPVPMDFYVIRKRENLPTPVAEKIRVTHPENGCN